MIEISPGLTAYLLIGLGYALASVPASAARKKAYEMGCAWILLGMTLGFLTDLLLWPLGALISWGGFAVAISLWPRGGK